jgi:ABC-type multidrug transport system ATPase subunit
MHRLYKIVVADHDPTAEYMAILLGIIVVQVLIHAVGFSVQTSASSVLDDSSELNGNAVDALIDVKPSVESKQETTGTQQSQRSATDDSSVTAGGPVSDHSASRPAPLVCTNIACSVPGKKSKKQKSKLIVDGVDFSVHCGQVLGCLGPSGAGKTSLLNAITFNCASGLKCSGSVEFGGETVHDLAEFSKYCVYIPQYDRYYATLTCREALTYTARFMAVSSPTAICSEVDQRIKRDVDGMLELLGLESCADVKAGSGGGASLSDGQKKRLSIGQGLLRNPQVLFLDEPTTGLDAASAFHVMNRLQEVAKERNVAIVATIHQPSEEIWNLLDKVLIMASGKSVYCGDMAHVEEYFSSIGHTLPASMNPAEFLLDLVNADFTDPTVCNAIISRWKSPAMPTSRRISNLPPPPKRDRRAALVAVVERELRVLWTDPTCYTARMVMYWCSCMFFCLVYWHFREPHQQNLMYKMFLMLWICASQSIFAVTAVTYYHASYQLARSEIRNNFYQPWMHHVAVLISSVPLLAVLAVCALLGTAFGVGNYGWDTFAITYINFFVMYLAFDFMAHVCSVAFDNLTVAMCSYAQYWFGSFLFMGLMLDLEEVIWPLRIFTYVMPFRWIYANLVYIQFAWFPQTFEGATVCAVGGNVSAASGCMYPNGNSVAGFSCGPIGSYSYPCLGFTGEEVLGSMYRLNYTVVKNENHVWRNIAIVFGMAIIHKIAHVLLFNRKVLQSSKMGIATAKPPVQQAKKQNTQVEPSEPPSQAILELAALARTFNLDPGRKK